MSEVPQYIDRAVMGASFVSGALDDGARLVEGWIGRIVRRSCTVKAVELHATRR